MSFGNTLSRLRKEKGWTQGELADKLQMNANHLSRWETDRILPRKKALEKLADLFQVPIEELLGAPEGPLKLPALGQEDPELAELVSQIVRLGDEHRKALRTVLRTMLTCQQLEQLVTQGRGAA
jgi:transcriptional regulator with XRE-family HTH domain